MDLKLAWGKCLSRKSRVFLWAPLVTLGGLLILGPGPRSITPAAASEGDAPKMISAHVPPVDAPKSISGSKRQLMLAAFIAQRWYLPSDDALAMVRIADRAAVRRSLDPVLILAMIAVESSFNAEAVSPMGAKGLMQVIPEFHPEKFPDSASVFDPEINVAAGTRILKEYLAQSGDLEMALQRYAGASADNGMVYANRIWDEVDRINAAIGAGPQRL